ncbi:MAG: glutamate racemase [bacterium]|nr:glutamate racemase [bacterium]
MCDRDAAVGVFDSGVGGLTVLRQIANRLPAESTIYLGDTARVPYGTKSGDTVVRYARACARLLCERGIKLLVVACNTASAYALDHLRDELPIPVLGVVDPGARAAVDRSRTGRIGVVGTAGTIASGQYQAVIKSLAPDSHVLAKACPLFVPLAEEGWTDGPVPELAAREYLAELLDEGIDTLVLGCTHYPLLKEVIARVVSSKVTLVDSAEATSVVVAEALEAMDALSAPDSQPRRRFLVTDDPVGFAKVGARFFDGHDAGGQLDRVEWVDIR